MTALGPSRRRSNPLILLSSPTARLARVFFTTVIRRPLPCRRRRMPLFLVASMPRGLMTATPSTSLNLLVSSRVIRSLTYLLIAVCPLSFVICPLSDPSSDTAPHSRNAPDKGPGTKDQGRVSVKVQHHRRAHRAFEHDLLEVVAL